MKITCSRYKKYYDDDTIIPINSSYEVNNNSSTINNKNSDCNSNSYNNSGSIINSSSNSDVSLINTPDKDLDTNNNYDAGPEKTWIFLY